MIDPDARLRRLQQIQSEQLRLYEQLRIRLDQIAAKTGMTLDLVVWDSDASPAPQAEIESSTIEIEREQVTASIWYLVRDAATTVILPRPLSIMAAARIGEAAV